MAPTIDMIQPWLSGLVPADGLAEVSGDERASDAEQNRDDKTTKEIDSGKRHLNAAAFG